MDLFLLSKMGSESHLTGVRHLLELWSFRNLRQVGCGTGGRLRPVVALQQLVLRCVDLGIVS